MMHERRIGIWTGSKWETYADLSTLKPGPLGDIVGDRYGNLYVDDVAFSMAEGEPPRPGRLLFVGADGEIRVAAEGLEFPNGLSFVDDERTLIAVESSAQRLTSFHVDAPGDLSDRRLYADIAALIGPMARPDGIWATRDGVWVATLAGNAVALVRNGRLVASIGTGQGCPIACCADDQSPRLFVTIADPGELGLMEALARKTVKTHVAVFDLGDLPFS